MNLATSGFFAMFRGRGRKRGKAGRPAGAVDRTVGRRLLRLEPLEDRSLLSASWYVATTGSNSNAGTSLAAPFRTIQQAALVARPGDTVYICAGTYHETVTPANSGTSAAPITFEPYNNAQVVVDGADPITGWTLYNSGAGGPIYVATMNWSYNQGDGDQVFVDGQMMNYARWPNTSLDVSDPTKATAATARTRRGVQTTPASTRQPPWTAFPPIIGLGRRSISNRAFKTGKRPAG